MDKWDFIEIIRQSDEIFVLPAGKIDLQWLRQRFPKSRTNGYNDGALDKVRLASSREANECYSAVVEYVGAQGWQALAAGYTGGQFLSLRRPSLAF